MRLTRSIVPNLMTLLNVFLGFAAMVEISKGDYSQATIYILVAGLFDTLDGITARLLKAASEFGVELDSLCDVVSFGVAPAYMTYHAFFFEYGSIGLLISSLPALTGVVRLARFNSNISGFEDKKYFIGMPIPGGALLIISYITFFHIPGVISGNEAFYGMIAVTVLTSLAMVSRIKFDNMPRPSWTYIKENPVKFIVFTVAVVAAIASQGKFIFYFMSFYLLFSAIRHFINWIREVRKPEDELDEDFEGEPGPYDE
jgi:CDP-diacylglycerol--serine O-phosphatidyltransferase